jgi:hypothetical protein
LVIRYDETKVPGLFPALPEPEETIQIEG